jgi:hypothetical protein
MLIYTYAFAVREAGNLEEFERAQDSGRDDGVRTTGDNGIKLASLIVSCDFSAGVPVRILLALKCQKQKAASCFLLNSGDAAANSSLALCHLENALGIALGYPG